MRILALGTGLLLHGVAAAPAEDAVMLPEVSVTEEKPTEAQQRAPTSFVSEVDVTNRDPAIETTTDVLQDVVGVQVQRYGGLGAFSTISIRGSSANQVPIYLDGIPISQAQDQTVNLSDLPLDGIQRIDVYRGTIPVGFGLTGIGGVVNLVTKPIPSTPSSEVSTGYGSFETRKVTASRSQQLGGLGVLAHLTYLGSKGDFTYTSDSVTPGQPSQEFTRINNAFDSVGLLLKGTQDLGPGVAADAVQEFFYKSQGVPGPAQNQPGPNTKFTKTSLFEVRSLTYGRLRAAGLLDGAVDTSGSAYIVYNRQEFDDPLGAFGSAANTLNQTSLLGVNNGGTWYAPLAQSVTWFDEFAYEVFYPFNATNEPDFPNNGPNQSRKRFTLGAQDTLPLLSGRVLVVPSLRYEHLIDEFSGVNAVDIFNTPPQTTNRDFWMPAVGLQVRLAPWLAPRANIGQFERAPSFTELFGNTGSVEGNPTLKPESGINRDVGFVFTPDVAGYLDRFRLEYAYFHNNITDLITYEQVSPTTFKAVNIGSARVAGDEVSLSTAAFSHLGLEVNYTHQNSAVTGGGETKFGDELPLLPADELFGHVELFNDWGKLYYECTYLSSNVTDPANFQRVPSRIIQTTGLVATPRDWLTIKFEAANIANADVRDVGDFPLPGLSFFGSIKVSL